jgi:Tat protein translocase TatC
MLAFLWASVVFALVLASPIVIWQAWAFIAAGLYAKERRIFYRYFPFMMVLLAIGVAFGYFIVLPTSLGVLIRWMDPDAVNALFSIGQFLTLEFALTGAMGLVFQLPLVMLALQKIGLVTHAGFRKNWRMTVLIIFVVAAILTPPEPISMLMMATPMLALYVIGLFLTWLGRGRDARIDALVPAP